MHHTVGYQEAQDTRFSRLNFSKRNIFHFIHFTKTFHADTNVSHNLIRFIFLFRSHIYQGIKLHSILRSFV